MKKWGINDRTKIDFKIKKMKLLSCLERSILKCPIQISNSTFKSTTSSVSMNRSGPLKFDIEEKLPQTAKGP